MTESEWLASEDPAAMLAVVTRDRRGEPAEIAQMASDRKLRLFVVAASRALNMHTDARLRAVEAWADGGPEPESDTFSYEIRNPAVAAERVASDAYALAYASGPVTPATVGWARAKKKAALRDIVGNPLRPVTLPPGQPERCPAGCVQIHGSRDRTFQVYESGGPDSRWVTCERCSGRGTVAGASPWLTPEVVSLATAAYEVRGRPCGRCYGTALDYEADAAHHDPTPRCPHCTDGALDDGALDPARLAVLSDALEEAGCPAEVEAPCPRCSPYADDPCPRCDGKTATWCSACGESGKFPTGYHPERNPASGRHEGGWTNCKTCNSGGSRQIRAGVVLAPHPLLAHLRSPGPHVRGCWAVDLILGRV